MKETRKKDFLKRIGMCMLALVMSVGTMAPVTMLVTPASTVRRSSSSKSKKKAGRKKKDYLKTEEVLSHRSLKNNYAVLMDQPGSHKYSDNKYNILYVYTRDGKVKVTSSNKKILKPFLNHSVYWKKNKYSNDLMLVPYKEGTATITFVYSGGKKKFRIRVKDTAAYAKVKKFVAGVKASKLDKAHKAFVVAEWMESKMTYGWQKTDKDPIVEGRGICGQYADTYKWLLDYIGIKSRNLDTYPGGHEWNQIQIRGKWYNVDTSWEDYARSKKYDPTYFMKSDYYYADFLEYPFNNYEHKVSDRLNPYFATSTDYDNYDWLSFTKSAEFKKLMKLK